VKEGPPEALRRAFFMASRNPSIHGDLGRRDEHGLARRENAPRSSAFTLNGGRLGATGNAWTIDALVLA
jgi:hypothetical protein